jgi:hypothetical protein
MSGESSSWICGACHGAVGISRRRLSSNEADAGWVRITLFVPAAGWGLALSSLRETDASERRAVSFGGVGWAKSHAEAALEDDGCL